jgi:hypothetical protein
MLATLAPAAYRLELTEAERSQLIVASELALAFRRGDPEARTLALDLDDATLDALCDRLCRAAP